MPIAPNGRIARNSNGMEDMDLFFADSPASIAPLERAKRISQLLEEQEEYDEEVPDETANYGGRGRISIATSRGARGEEEEDEEEYDEDEASRTIREEEYYDDEQQEYSRNDATGVSSVHRGRRQSRRSDMYGGEASMLEQEEYNVIAEEDDGGTKTMSLEGSKQRSLAIVLVLS